MTCKQGLLRLLWGGGGPEVGVLRHCVGQLLQPQLTFGDVDSQRRLVAQNFGNSAQEETTNITLINAEQAVIKKAVQICSKGFNQDIYKAGYSSKIKIGLNEDFANNRNETLAN